MNTPLKPVRQLVLGILLAGAVASASAVEPTATIGVKGRANSYASLAASGRFAALVWGARTTNDVTVFSLRPAPTEDAPVIATADDATIVAWTSGSSGQTTLRTRRLMN